MTEQKPIGNVKNNRNNTKPIAPPPAPIPDSTTLLNSSIPSNLSEEVLGTLSQQTGETPPESSENKEVVKKNLPSFTVDGGRLLIDKDNVEFGRVALRNGAVIKPALYSVLIEKLVFESNDKIESHQNVAYIKGEMFVDYKG